VKPDASEMPATARTSHGGDTVWTQPAEDGRSRPETNIWSEPAVAPLDFFSTKSPQSPKFGMPKIGMKWSLPLPNMRLGNSLFVKQELVEDMPMSAFAKQELGEEMPMSAFVSSIGGQHRTCPLVACAKQAQPADGSLACDLCGLRAYHMGCVWQGPRRPRYRTPRGCQCR
jgi:hypothetical protein